MTRVSPRTNFHSSELIRCLVKLGIVEAMGPANAFAEKLAVWIHFTDAITLSSVHNDGSAGEQKIKSKTQFVADATASIELDRVRTILVNSIVESCSPNSGKSLQLPTLEIELPGDLAVAYLPYRQFYEAHQRNIESNLQPLKATVRKALAK